MLYMNDATATFYESPSASELFPSQYRELLISMEYVSLTPVIPESHPTILHIKVQLGYINDESGLIMRDVYIQRLCTLSCQLNCMLNNYMLYG